MINPTTSSSQRWWDPPAAFLLLAAALTAASRLVATRWTEHLGITQTLVFFGVFAGLALGQSRFRPRVAGLIGFLYGAFAIPWQLGMTLKDDLIWTERLSILINRLSVIIVQLIQKEAIQDSLLFVVLMAILFWALGVHAGYTLVRDGDAWRAVLPSGLATFVIHSFDPLVTRRTWYLAVYLFFALVLVARMVYLHHHSRWQTSHTALPPHLGLEFIRFTIIATTIIVLFSWTAPAMANALPAAQKAWQPVQRAWNDTKQRFENVFASLRPSAVAVSEVYGSSAVLGRGSELSDTQMFLAKVPDSIPTNVRLYWRARTYDTYEDGQWFSTIPHGKAFKPEDELPVPRNTGRWYGSIEFIASVHMATIFVPPQPLWVSRPAQIELIENADGTVDISAIQATPSLDPGQVYKVQAALNNASIAQLMASADTEYPKWVTERYLQLPNTITSRTRQLAEEITVGAQTPYDKVIAVTNYLRKNITYVEEIEEDLPARQEAIDWFLFDLRKGFCNYYSTSQVIMLRSLGIPARWAVGYAQGEIWEGEAAPGSADDDKLTYVVREREAHAWPEVYFPNVGWVEFEPTAVQPEIVRAAGDTVSNPSVASSNTDDEEERLRREMEEELAMLRAERNSMGPLDVPQQNPTNVVYWLLPLALGIGLLVLNWRFRLVRVGSRNGYLYLDWRENNVFTLRPVPIILESAFTKAGIRAPQFVQLWARRAMLPPLAKAYLEINSALSRLGKGPAVTDTPTERATTLGQLIPPADQPAHQLVNEYQIEIFGKQPANLTIALTSAAMIKNLSIKAYLQRLFARLQRPASTAHQNRE